MQLVLASKIKPDNFVQKLSNNATVKTLKGLEQSRADRFKHGVRRIKKTGKDAAEGLKALDADARKAFFDDLRETLSVAAKIIDGFETAPANGDDDDDYDADSE